MHQSTERVVVWAHPIIHRLTHHRTHIPPHTQAKGDEIRDLKAQKAEKDAIMPLVGQLNVRA